MGCIKQIVIRVVIDIQCFVFVQVDLYDDGFGFCDQGVAGFILQFCIFQYEYVFEGMCNGIYEVLYVWWFYVWIDVGEFIVDIDDVYGDVGLYDQL